MGSGARLLESESLLWVALVESLDLSVLPRPHL